jgi:DnaK suppressor protein
MSAILRPESCPVEPGVVRLEEWRARLLGRARELSAQDAQLRERLASEQAVTANTFVAGTEAACAAEADDEVIAMLHHEQLEFRAIQDALARMADGTYGACLECGEPIGALRLSVLPEAALCVGCQSVAEHRAAHQAAR